MAAEPQIGFATLDRDTAERFQRLREQLGATSLGINLIVLRPGERGRIHAHAAQEEVYLVLEGELTLFLDGAEHRLVPDQLVRLGPATRRQIANESDARVVLFALSAAGGYPGRDGLAWGSWDDHGPGAPPGPPPTG
jgi:uncharacterized cupin superfamily protein